jgi:hypothetical protein
MSQEVVKNPSLLCTLPVCPTVPSPSPQAQENGVAERFALLFCSQTCKNKFSNMSVNETKCKTTDQFKKSLCDEINVS